MNELDIDETFLDVIKPALEKSRKENVPVISNNGVEGSITPDICNNPTTDWIKPPNTNP